MIKRCIAALIAATALLAAVSPAQASKPRSKAERAFLTEMVGHHAMAVDMAEMAMMRATHPELKTLAENIISTQTAEMDKMQSWLKRWYGKTAMPEMGHHEMAQMEELEQSATAAEFEVRFLALMTMHHTQAIERAREVKKARIHSVTRKLANDIIDAQTAEIDQMRAWLVAWYAN
jgi:uncharacterized protein (DUF305 family)